MDREGPKGERAGARRIKRPTIVADETRVDHGITGQDGSYLAELLLGEGLRSPRHSFAAQARSTPSASIIFTPIHT
jgi:hypothetical protein